MSIEKLEPRLANLIEDNRVRAERRGMALSAVEGQTFEVTISHQDYVRAEEHEDRRAALNELARRIEQAQAPIVAKLGEIGAEARIQALTNAVTTTLTPAQLAQIAELDEVKIIRHERLDPVTTMNESPRLIEVFEAWEDFGATGRGIKVAVLDSGVDKNHPALSGKVVDEVSTAGEPVGMPGNHGTHVAGTIASNDPIYRGIAYQADLINIKVLTAAGSGQPQSVIAGLEQAVRRGALVANLSLGWSEFLHGWVCNDADCILCQAADNAVRLGVTVVVAAGNEDSSAPAGKFNIRHPGAARRVITVGAVDKAKVLANFSSIGPSSGRLSTGSPARLTKPDLSGPGVGITSSVLGGGFAAFNGTSMASPHVAGVAALVLERNSGLRPRMVKKLLEDTCEPLPFAPNQVGYGLVNAYAALIRTVTK
ncbi:MAG: S8 family peptidase [Actinomycetota bacterium]